MTDVYTQSQTLLDPETIQGTDFSKQILDQLFGSGWNVPGSIGTMVDSSSLLFDLMYAFNVVVLAVGVAIMSWSFIQGVVGTAHEGKFIGQRMHSVWAPFRSGVSVIMLAPVLKGLCTIQALVLIGIACSVNLANYLWTSSLDYMAEHSGQVYELSAPPALNENTKTLAQGILKSLAIHNYLVLFQELKFDNLYEVKENESIFGDSWIVTFNAPADGGFFGLSNSDSGKIIIPNHGDKAISPTRYNAVVRMINDLFPLAEAIVATTHPGYEDMPIDRSIMQRAIETYNSTITPLIPQIMEEEHPGYQDRLDTFVSDAKKNGWAFAGSYYWNISAFAEEINAIAQDEPKYHPGDEDLLGQLSDSDLTPILMGVETISHQVRNSMRVAQEAAPESTGVMAKIRQWQRDTLGALTIDLTISKISDGDPIANLSSLGHILVDTMVGSITAFTLAKAAVAGSEKIGGLWTKAIDSLSGAPFASARAALYDALKTISPFLLMMSIPLFCMGLSLAYYLPAMPFIAWISAFIGWLLLVMETIFAAPLWAVAHSLPEGEGLAGQHARTGYMMLLGVLLRPPLMVVGFTAAIIIMPLVGKVVGAMFLVYTGTIAADHFTGIVTCLAFMFLGGFIMIIVAHKVFKLITHLPETVVRWIGQTMQNLGEDADEHRTRAMFTGAVGKVEGGIGGGMRGKGPSSKQTNPTNSGDKEQFRKEHSGSGPMGGEYD